MEVSSVNVKVKVARKRKVIIKPWPVIHLSSWMKECFGNRKYEGFFFLGGRRLEDWNSAQELFKTFWDRYSKIDPDAVPKHPSQTVPVYLHGDEGRGLGKRPLLVISFQPVMGWLGDCVPSTKYICPKEQLWFLIPIAYCFFWVDPKSLWGLGSLQPKAYFHDSIGLHYRPIGVLCPQRCNSWWSAQSPGLWPQSIAWDRSWGQVCHGTKPCTMQ